MVRADESNEETKLTFSEAVEIPGQTLPAGTYWFVLANINSNRDIVQILSADRLKVYATVFTTPSERRQVSDETTLTFAETLSSQPVQY